MKFKTFVVFGSSAVIRENGENAISEYEFNTQEELDAFLYGVEEASGWLDHYTAETREKAEEYVKEYID